MMQDNYEKGSILLACSHQVWAFDTNQPNGPLFMAKVPTTTPCTQFEAFWAPKNISFASAGEDGRVTFYQPEGEYLGELFSSHLRPLHTLHLHPKSRLVATGDDSGCVRIWDLKDKNIVFSWTSHNQSAVSVRFSPNLDHLASASVDGSLHIHHIRTGKTTGKLNTSSWTSTHSSDPLKMIQYSPIHRNDLAACSDQGNVYILDLARETLSSSFSAHQAPCSAITYNHTNGEMIYTTGLNKCVIFRDLRVNRPIAEIKLEHPGTALDVTMDDSMLGVGTSRGQVLIYDLANVSKPVQFYTIPVPSPYTESSAHTVNFVKFHWISPNVVNQPTNYRSSRHPSNLNKANSPKDNSSSPVILHPSLIKKSSIATRATEVADTLKTSVFSPINPMVNAKSQGSQVEPKFKSMKPSILSPSFAPLNISRSNPELNPFVPTQIRLTKADSISHHNSPNFNLFSPLVTKPTSGPPNLSSSLTEVSPIPCQISKKVIKSVQLSSSDEPSLKITSSTIDKKCVHDPTKNEHVVKAASSIASNMTPIHLSPKILPLENPLSSASQDGVAYKQLKSLDNCTLPHPPSPFPSPSNVLNSLESNHFKVSASEPLPSNAIQDLLTHFMHSLESSIKEQIQNLHVDMIRQFQIQQNEISTILEGSYVQKELMEENKRLREENERLKRFY